MFHIRLDDSDDDLQDGGNQKRLKIDNNQPKVLIDLTNTQSQDNVGPTERQHFFDSQHYKTKYDDRAKKAKSFPGPAGVKQRGSKGKKTIKKDENKNLTRQSLFKDVTFICSPSDNSTWKALKEYYNLHYQQKNNLLNKINIRMLQDKLKRLNHTEGRTPVPFLAAVIVDDGGIGSVSNDKDKMSCFSILLEDLTGTITALLDTKVVFQLGHLLRFGSSIILKDPDFHKICGNPQLSVVTKMISCVAVNTKVLDLKIERDTPDGFWPKMIEDDVIIFEQRKLEVDVIDKEILEFENKVRIARRSLTTIPSTSEKSNADGSEKWIKFSQQKGKDDHNVKVTATGSNDANMKMAVSSLIASKTSIGKHVISGDFADNWDDDLFDSSMIEIADELESKINGSKSTNNANLSQNKSPHNDSFSCQQKPVEVVGEFDDDSDDDILNATMIKVADEYEVQKNLAVNDQNEKVEHQGTSKKIYGEFPDCADDDDDSLALELENFENSSMRKENEDNQKLPNNEQFDDDKKNDRIVGEFDDDDDDEIDSLFINAMNDGAF